ncbi:MAG TPA: ATP-binding cassette domain-containing protein, partial [Nitrososphaeria archaeon]|nr:ATP-binding cassette domain-containing protein [Nitrososphaeria archaeon]
MQESVEAHKVTFRFGEKLALEDVSFKIPSPFYCAVMGPNGAGKTTLLKIMLGLLKPQSGWIKIYGYDP